jgi:hypothetical protein
MECFFVSTFRTCVNDFYVSVLFAVDYVDGIEMFNLLHVLLQHSRFSMNDVPTFWTSEARSLLSHSRTTLITKLHAYSHYHSIVQDEITLMKLVRKLEVNDFSSLSDD